jgi:hypothetical protein
VDLFNAGYFWEAHEAWEELWVARPRRSAEALLLQGLIQTAAALVKIRLGAPDPARALARRGLDKLARVSRQSPILMGLDVGRVHSSFMDHFRPLAERILPPSDAPVPRLRLCGARIG